MRPAALSRLNSIGEIEPWSSAGLWKSLTEMTVAYGIPKPSVGISLVSLSHPLPFQNPETWQ